jgi:Zn-finger nucleic acid-binding protein
MQCPKCQHALSSVPVADGEFVERCAHCLGIVCSDGALANLQRQWFYWPDSDLRAIDVGRAADGKLWNELHAVACPRCAADMQVVDGLGRVPIELERCADCRLIFFDAGEMTDLQYRVLADFVRESLCASLGC